MASEADNVKIPDVADFFQSVSDDLSKVKWGHAVNSKAELDKCLADDTMMLEADILPGHLKGSDDSAPVIPIMAHPPSVVSDISFEMWLKEVIKANKEGLKKGIKLDFKDLAVVEECLSNLKKNAEEIQFPLWLNADILKGLGKDLPDPVDADKFLSLCKEYFPQATLSVGWKTVFIKDDESTRVYELSMVQQMVETLSKNNITQPVTFPIRAAFIANSLESLEWLSDNVPVPDNTISVWSAESDTVDMEALIVLQNSVGAENIYFDLPKEQQEEFEKAKVVAAAASAVSYQFLPTNLSSWATVGFGIASALAALYLYE